MKHLVRVLLAWWSAGCQTTSPCGAGYLASSKVVTINAAGEP